MSDYMRCLDAEATVSLCEASQWSSSQQIPRLLLINNVTSSQGLTRLSYLRRIQPRLDRAVIADWRNDVDVDTLSTRIRAARVNGGLSQTDLAKALGVNRATVGHWEREQGFLPTVDHLQNMASVLSVSVSWLVGDQSPPPAIEGTGARSSLEARMIALSKHLPVSFLHNVVALMESAESYL